MTANLDWMAEALCATHPNADLWFPNSVGLAAKKQADAAARVCAACPVQRQCRDHKQYTGAATGVWGGDAKVSARVGPSAGGPQNSGAAHGTDAGYAKHHYYGETPCAACRAAHSAKWAPGGKSKTRRWSA